MSATQEWLKNVPYEDAFEGALSSMANLHRDRVGNLASAFGWSNLHVYRFEDAAGHEKGVAGHFLGTLGVGSGELARLKVRRSNTRMSRAAADILSFIDSREPRQRSGIGNPGRQPGDINPLLRLSGPRFDLKARDKRVVRKVAEADLRWLSSRCGIQFPEPPVADEEGSWMFSAELVGEIRAAHSSLSPTLQRLLVEYLREKAEDPACSALAAELDDA